MRRIVLDTETTGLEPAEGHRIIELACLEMSDRRQTGRHFHRYLNPERSVDLAATQVHGLTTDDLSDKPRFADIADEFLEFVHGCELLIHNAPFDVAFLNAELERAGRARVDSVCTVSDTLEMARDLHPGKKNSLDAQLLADVWLAMTRGQDTLDIMMAAAPAPALALAQSPRAVALRVLRAGAEELALHLAMCERIDKESKGRCLWMRIPAAS